MSCRRSKWTLLLLGPFICAALLLLSFQSSGSFLQDAEDIFAFATYGSAPGITYESTQTQSAENSTLYIELTENATKYFVQLGNPVLMTCNSPFLKKSLKMRYVNISHDHVASIVLLSTGYHTPEPELQKDTPPSLKPFIQQVSCDYAAAASNVFDDSLYTSFVGELEKLLISSSTWRHELGFDSQLKSGNKFRFKARCVDGQLTTLGLAQHLAAGRNVADAFNQTNPARSFLQTALKRGNKIKLPVTLRRSKANALGVLATVFAMAYDLTISVSLSQLADSLQISWSEYDNLCDTNTASQKNVSVPSCECDCVQVAEREYRTCFDNAIMSLFVADGVNKKFPSSYRAMLDRFGISRAEPHRLFDAVRQLHVPVCALPDTLLCTNSSVEQRRCLTLYDIQETFSSSRSLYAVLTSQLRTGRLSVLRSFPLAYSLFSKVSRITANAAPPVEFLLVDSQTLTDLLRIFGVSLSLIDQSLQCLPFGSVVTLEVFRTTHRKPGTLVVRLVVNGLSVLRQSRLCGSSYSGMCDLQNFLLASNSILSTHLGRSDYNSACVQKFAI